MMKIDEIEKKIIRYYASKIRENPSSYLFLPLADSYRRRGMPETAIDICKRGLAHHPKYMSAKALLGELYFVCKRYDAAERELKCVAESKSQNLLARKILVGVCKANGMFKEALRWSEQLIEIQPGSGEFLNMMKNVQEMIEKEQEVSGSFSISSQPAEKNKSDDNPPKTQETTTSELVSKKDKTIKDLQKLYSGLHDIDDVTNSAVEPDGLLKDNDAFNEIGNLFNKSVEESDEAFLNEQEPLELFEKMLSNLNDIKSE